MTHTPPPLPAFRAYNLSFILVLFFLHFLVLPLSSLITYLYWDYVVTDSSVTEYGELEMNSEENTDHFLVKVHVC